MKIWPSCWKKKNSGEFLFSPAPMIKLAYIWVCISDHNKSHTGPSPISQSLAGLLGNQAGQKNMTASSNTPGRIKLSLQGRGNWKLFPCKYEIGRSKQIDKRKVYNLSSIFLMSAAELVVLWRSLVFSPLIVFLQCNKVCMDFIQTRLGN